MMSWRDYEVKWDNLLTMAAAVLAAWSYTGRWESAVIAYVFCYLLMK